MDAFPSCYPSSVPREQEARGLGSRLEEARGGHTEARLRPQLRQKEYFLADNWQVLLFWVRV